MLSNFFYGGVLFPLLSFSIKFWNVSSVWFSFGFSPVFLAGFNYWIPTLLCLKKLLFVRFPFMVGHFVVPAVRHRNWAYN